MCKGQTEVKMPEFLKKIHVFIPKKGLSLTYQQLGLQEDLQNLNQNILLNKYNEHKFTKTKNMK